MKDQQVGSTQSRIEMMKSVVLPKSLGRVGKRKLAESQA